MQKFKPDNEKLKELILYVCEKSANDPHFGATKLNKILFLSDFWAFGDSGRPITGVEYMKLPLGPVPRPLLPIRKEMEKQGDLAVQETTLNPGMARKKPINLRAANLERFTAGEIALVDKVIDFCERATGSGVSRYTHLWHGWIAADEGETIPYETVFISDEPITQLEIARGKELAAKYAWQV